MSSERKIRATLLAALLTIGSPAVAQDVSNTAAPPFAGGDDIVVTGRRPVPPKAFERTVKSFVEAQGQPGPIGQVPRWGEPVCPSTTGLSPQFNAFVTQRIKQIAARVGAPGPADCRGANNVLVIFTIMPDTLMADVRKRHEGLLGYHFNGETAALAAFRPPMKSWYVTATLIPGHYYALDHAYGPSPPAGSASRIRLPYKSRFAFALVVIDANLLEGQAIGPVADKIAMLALSSPAMRRGCSALPSIVDLLESDCPTGQAVDQLTSYDEAFLRGLYAFDRDELKGYMREKIRKRVTQDTVSPDLTVRP